MNKGYIIFNINDKVIRRYSEPFKLKILAKIMRKSKFSPQQTSKILREFDTGKSDIDITRNHGVSSAAFYK
jgi:hypothetical protein